MNDDTNQREVGPLQAVALGPSEAVALRYTRFRLVNCKSQRKRLRNAVIKTLDGKQLRYAFSRACAGPYGEDLQSPWLDKDQMIYMWSGRNTLLGKGWFDIHAMTA